MAYTPGPWKTDHEVGDESVLAPDGVMVADCAIFAGRRRSGETNRANARLIAAAPDLLDALRALMHEYVPADDSEPDPKTRAVIDRCRAAIVKATTTPTQES